MLQKDVRMRAPIGSDSIEDARLQIGRADNVCNPNTETDQGILMQKYIITAEIEVEADTLCKQHPLFEAIHNVIHKLYAVNMPIQRPHSEILRQIFPEQPKNNSLRIVGGGIVLTTRNALQLALQSHNFGREPEAIRSLFERLMIALPQNAGRQSTDTLSSKKPSIETLHPYWLPFHSVLESFNDPEKLAQKRNTYHSLR